MPSSSDFWGSNYAPITLSSTLRKRIARQLNVTGMKKDRQLINALLGAVAGSAALVNYRRVKHDLIELGGVRQIENVPLVNRNTTAADDTDLTSKLLTYTSRPATYPPDLGAYNR